MFARSSFPWLFMNELRVLWRSSILVRTSSSVLVPVLVVGLVFQAVALLLAWAITKHPLPRDEMILVADLNLFFFGFLMLSRAMTAAIDVLYARGDVDFLLASPIPPGRVLAVRMIGVGASVASPWVLLAGALANGLIIFKQYWALAVYPMILAEGMLAAAIAFALVVMLVGWVGPAAARRAGHILALFVGVFIFALGQAPRFISPEKLGRFWQSVMPTGPATGWQWVFGRGLLGEPAPLAISVLICLIAFLAVWATLDGRFASGAITAAAYRPAGNATRQTGEFRNNPGRAIFMKNLRLLTRFPGIVSQTVYRALTLVPVLMILSGKLKFGAGNEAVAPLLVFLAGQLGLFFISVMVGSDESPDLAATAPVTRQTLRATALTAACYATIILITLPVLGVALRAPNLVPATLAGITGALLTNVTLGYRFPIPLIKADFGKAQNGTALGLLVGVGISSAWSAAAWLAVAPHPFAWLLGK
jgi:ABC-2 type transport system permease protein